ncbi:hypothetical protein H7827_21425 [Streptomyces sp. JH002]|uniref:hypothetical protein n=1 Tax=Streptomyces sp. JH002 TaxID=2763259 RepID=UPI003D8037C4
MSDFIVLPFVLAPVVFVAAAFGLVVHAVQRAWAAEWPTLASPRALGLVSALALSGALTLYAYAHMTYMSSLRPEHLCWLHADVRGMPDERSDFPLSMVCGGAEVVPAWINPALFVLPVIGLAAMAAAVRYASTRPDRKSSQV